MTQFLSYSVPQFFSDPSLFPFNTSDGETRAEAGRKELWGWHGRSGMEGAVWKVLEGMVDMDGMEGMDGIPCKDTTFL